MPDRWPALTIRQPWAFAIAYCGKTVENRGWKTLYRGPLWIHAGARSRWDPGGASFPLIRDAWRAYLHDHVPGWPELPASDVSLCRRTTLIPFGAVAALAEVTGCHHAADCYTPAGDSRAPGAYCSPWGALWQFHIELASIRPLREPVPCAGSLGLWRLPADVEQAARAQLEAADA